jgi:hypothetical protein
MKKNILKISLFFLVMLFPLIIFGKPILASEWNGNLNTGLSGTISTTTVTGTIEGAVVTTPTTPASDNGGGGGSSGGSGGGGGGGGGGYYYSVAKKGDANNDGRVDILDFVSLMANWGKTGYGNIADFNGDGKVDILDFVLLMANWTK